MHWNLLGEGASGRTRVGYVPSLRLLTGPSRAEPPLIAQPSDFLLKSAPFVPHAGLESIPFDRGGTSCHDPLTPARAHLAGSGRRLARHDPHRFPGRPVSTPCVHKDGGRRDRV